jgi:toxin ParE1/3/4
MKIIWGEKALDRASEYADYIAEDSKSEAEKWLIELFGEVKRLEMFPESARVVPELNDPNIREVIFKNFRIIYEISVNNINILTVRRFRQELDIDEIK